MREIMASVARWYSDSDGTLVTTGVGNAFVLTTNNAHTLLTDIPLITFRINRANTGSATLAVDGLVAKNIQSGGVNIIANELIIDTVITVAYNATSDAFDIVNTLSVAQMSAKLGLAALAT